MPQQSLNQLLRRIKIPLKVCHPPFFTKFLISQSIFYLDKPGGGQAPPNPFKDFFEKTLQSTNMVKRPMTRQEAMLILNQAGKEEEELDPEAIMDVS